jgi:hypothetical protein
MMEDFSVCIYIFFIPSTNQVLYFQSVHLQGRSGPVETCPPLSKMLFEAKTESLSDTN